MSQEIPSGWARFSALWATLPAPARAAVAAVVALVAISGALLLFGSHNASHSTPAQNAVVDPMVRLQISAEEGQSVSLRDVQARVDNQPVDASERFALKPGTHTLHVSAIGYRPFDQQLQARAGEHLEVLIQLRPAPKSASGNSASSRSSHPAASSPSSSQVALANSDHNTPNVPGLPAPRIQKPQDSRSASAPSAPSRSAHQASSSSSAQSSSANTGHKPTEVTPDDAQIVHIGKNIILKCTDLTAATPTGRQPLAESLMIEIEMMQSGRARLPNTLIPTVHMGVTDGWVNFSRVAVTERDITATVGFSPFDHRAIRVDRMNGQVSLSGWNKELSGKCHNL